MLTQSQLASALTDAALRQVEPLKVRSRQDRQRVLAKGRLERSRSGRVGARPMIAAWRASHPARLPTPPPAPTGAAAQRPITGSAAASTQLGIVRYTAGGVLAPSFGTSGITTAGFGSDSGWAQALAIQPDGKLVMAGTRDLGSSSQRGFFVGRFWQ